MQILHDMHIHSTFSVDAHDEILAMCRASVEKGMEAICFTEHLDFHPADSGYKYFDYEEFSRVIDHAREEFGSEIEILKGIEFGEPHLYPEKFTEITRREFDLILGSVHRIGDRLVGRQDTREKFSKHKIFEKYYAEVLKTVDFGGFDVLAHFDLPKRYMRAPFKEHELIDAILDEMIDSGIVLEINTSPLRRGKKECCPDKVLFSQYVEKGGDKITVGSDAHYKEKIGSDFEYIQNHLLNDISVQVGIFRQREFTRLFNS